MLSLSFFTTHSHFYLFSVFFIEYCLFLFSLSFHFSISSPFTILLFSLFHFPLYQQATKTSITSFIKRRCHNTYKETPSEKGFWLEKILWPVFNLWRWLSFGQLKVLFNNWLIFKRKPYWDNTEKFWGWKSWDRFYKKNCPYKSYKASFTTLTK